MEGGAKLRARALSMPWRKWVLPDSPCAGAQAGDPLTSWELSNFPARPPNCMLFSSPRLRSCGQARGLKSNAARGIGNRSGGAPPCGEEAGGSGSPSGAAGNPQNFKYDAIGVPPRRGSMGQRCDPVSPCDAAGRAAAAPPLEWGLGFKIGFKRYPSKRITSNGQR